MRAHHLPALLLLLAATPATASPGQPIAVDHRGRHDFSLTGSLLLLDVQVDAARYNLLELTAEWRRGDKVGLAAIAGAGRVIVEDDSSGYELGIFDLGGQAYYCLVGDFDHGLQIGVEAVFIGLHGGDRWNGSIDATVGGLSAAPFLGYKLALRSGFTVIVQAGGGVLVSTTYASHEPSDTEVEQQAAGFVPLANLNLGWSF